MKSDARVLRQGSSATAIVFVLVIKMCIRGQEADLGHQTGQSKEKSREGHTAVLRSQGSGTAWK